MVARYPQDDPTLAALIDLLGERGRLTASEIVDRAADPESPLHAHFEWDDRIAAAEFRLEQARVLVRRYRITAPDLDVNIRRFSNVEIQGERGYVETLTAFANPFLRQQILDRMLADAKSFAERYSRYSEAAGIIVELRAFIEERETAAATG